MLLSRFFALRGTFLSPAHFSSRMVRMTLLVGYSHRGALLLSNEVRWLSFVSSDSCIIRRPTVSNIKWPFFLMLRILVTNRLLVREGETVLLLICQFDSVIGHNSIKNYLASLNTIEMKTASKKNTQHPTPKKIENQAKGLKRSKST